MILLTNACAPAAAEFDEKHQMIFNHSTMSFDYMALGLNGHGGNGINHGQAAYLLQ
jgi:hypothetical protein